MFPVKCFILFSVKRVIVPLMCVYALTRPTYVMFSAVGVVLFSAIYVMFSAVVFSAMIVMFSAV